MRTLPAFALGAFGGAVVGATLTYWLVDPAASGIQSSFAPDPVPASTVAPNVAFTRVPGAPAEANLPQPPPQFAPQVSSGSFRASGPPIVIQPNGVLPANLPPELAARLEASRRLATATQADIEGMLDAAAANPDPASRRAELRQLLNRLAAFDFDAALRRAAALPGGLDRDSLQAILVLGGTPEQLLTVIEQAATTRDATRRNELLTLAFSRWATQAPLSALEYIDANAERLGIELTRSTSVLTSVAMQGDARQMLAAADTVRPEIATAVRRGALQRLSRDNPRAAALYLASLDLPNAAEQLSLASSIAGAYVDADVESALAWVRGQPSQVEVSLLTRLAQSQPQRAVELALASTNPETVSRAGNVASSAMRASGADRARIADLFLSQPRNAESNQGLENLLGMWADNDADAAIDWLLAKGSSLPVAVLRGAANRMTQAPEVAARYVDRVPAEVRGDWLRAIATNYARKNPAAGVAFIERLRGEPGYDDILLAGSQGLSQSDPEAAVRLLDRVADPRKKVSGYSNVAFVWARMDPRAAARWAVDIDDPALVEQALQRVAMQWAAIDVRAAEDWARAVPFGTRRDTALTALLTAPSFNEASPTASPDHPFWSAFSDDGARERAAMQAAQRLAGRDAAAARRLIDRHIDDPRLRASAENMLSQSSPNGGLQTISNGSVILRPQ